MGANPDVPHDAVSRNRFFTLPATSLGAWSFKLLVGWVALLLCAFAVVALHGGAEATRRMSMAAGGKFYSLPSVAVPVAASFLSGIASFFAALAAIIKGERSVTMLLPLVLGGLVLLFAIGELFE